MPSRRDEIDVLGKVRISSTLKERKGKLGHVHVDPRMYPLVVEGDPIRCLNRILYIIILYIIGACVVTLAVKNLCGIFCILCPA